MTRLSLFIWRSLSAVLGVSAEALRFAREAFRSHGSLVAENLFLRKQLAFYQKRNIKPPTTDGFREVCAAVLVALVSLAQCPRGGKTGNPDRLAPAGLPAFLAVEIHEVSDRSCLKT